MVSIPSRSRLLSTAFRRDLALKRYGRGANLVAMTGLPSKPPSRNISPMILSEAPLPYTSAVSTSVTPSAMLVRKALPTSLRLYSLPYPQSLVVPHAQAPTPRGATFSSSARPIVSSLCKATPLIPSPRYLLISAQISKPQILLALCNRGCDVSLVSETLLGLAELDLQLCEALTAEVLQLHAFEVLPDTLVGVEIRSIARQLFELQPP